MEIHLIDIVDAKGRLIQTTLVLPESSGGAQVQVQFKVPFGAGGSYLLSSVIVAAAVQRYDDFFIMHDGHDGTQNTRIPTTWIRDVAAAALNALPRAVGTLDLSVAFVRADSRCPF